MPKVSKPVLTNRGAAGLHDKLSGAIAGKAAEEEQRREKWRQNLYMNHVRDRIRCPGEVVEIGSLVPDPMNARLHPERNMQAIKDSLARFGQTKALVVRKQNRVVIAGNGTMEAAKQLGWTKLAVSIIEMTDVEAACYGVADNRAGEHAKWDYEVVETIAKIVRELDPASPDFGTYSAYDMPGWSMAELMVLRDIDWEEAKLIPDEEEGDDPEEVPYQEGDAELLERLKVTLADPDTKVQDGETYKIGNHLLVVADPLREHHLWLPLLQPDWIFAPYPGPLTPLTLEAEKKSILMVQPDHFIAGWIIDHWKAIYGEEEVYLAESE